MNPIENLKALIVYQSQKNENISVEVLYDNEDFWLTQKSMSKLFNVEVNTINYHLKEIFETYELEENRTIRKIRTLQKEGNREVSRELATKLKCSIRPIYYQFENVEEMQKELYLKIEHYFYKFILDNMVEEIPKYKQVGINYIKFAKKEKKLFQTLFMSDTGLTPDAFVLKSGKDYKEIEKLIKISAKLKEEDIKDFHTRMWIFCHGIATLVANDTIKLTDNQIQDLLSYEFQALMLLEENPNNKWVINKKEEN